MSNILKSGAKVHGARTFLKSFYDAGGTDRVYIGLSNRGAEWSPDQAIPDVPIDSFALEQTFWQSPNLIGIGEVTQATMSDLVVPRKTWVSGTTYALFNEATVVGSGTFDSATGRNFYVCNTNSTPRVYECVRIGGGSSTSMPSHTKPLPVYPTDGEADGYMWRYLYTIGSPGHVGTSLLTTSWMPVPSLGSVGIAPWAVSTAYGLGGLATGTGANHLSTQIYQVTATTGNSAGASMSVDTGNTWAPWYGDMKLGAFWVGAQVAFPPYDGGAVPIQNVPYRQVALLRNPLSNTGARLTAAYVASGFETNVSRGVVLTLDNRVTITRAAGQTETVRIILEF